MTLLKFFDKALGLLKYTGQAPLYMSKGWAMHYTGFNERYFDRLVEMEIIEQYPIKDLLFPDSERSSHYMYSKIQLNSLSEKLEEKIRLKFRQIERVA